MILYAGVYIGTMGWDMFGSQATIREMQIAQSILGFGASHITFQAGFHKIFSKFPVR